MTRVRIVCGVGGAGKTTSAAALGLAAAKAGERAVVLTIDPARRLADALGLAHLGNTPQALPLPDDVPGTLHALMLDAKATWDDTIRRHAPDEATAERLLANPYYEALSTRLTGGHEYMATEKLHQLVSSDRWDVVIVDTPPSQHAFDFFRAPARIRRILDPRLLDALFRPSRGLLGAATRRVVDVVRRLAGSAVLDDLEDFFGLVRDLGDGFRERGAAVATLLHDPACRTFLVANALAPRDEDLLDFLGQLREEGMHFEGFLLNRVLTPLGAQPDALLEPRPPVPDGLDDPTWDRVLAGLLRHARHHAEVAQRHADLAARLHRAGEARVVSLPEVEGGVRDLEGLALLAGALA